GSASAKNATSKLCRSHVWGSGCEATWDLISTPAPLAGIRSTERASGWVLSFRSSATIGTGHLSGDLVKREEARRTARGRSALASRHERGSSPPKLVRTEALSFFSQEEVARARASHRPLYRAAAADVAIEASVLGALVWSGAGAALDPGSLPWWGRTPAYAAIVVAASAAVRAPLALWSG